MGLSLTRPWAGLIGKREMKLLMVGLDAAGKTTVLYKLKPGEVLTTMPTIGHNVERVEYRNLSFTSWDVGGQHEIRRFWAGPNYFQGTHAVIFVVDSSDRDRAEDAREELWKMPWDEELHEATLLVIANKQDLRGAMTAAEVSEKLSLHELRNRRWHIQPACATAGEGIYEGLEWLSKALAA